MLEYDPGYGPLVETRVRVVTWNVWGRYGPWEQRLPAITSVLQSLQPDIVALQEVWEDDTRSQMRELASALGFRAGVFAPNLERDGARAGNAVLARWPIAQHEFRLLPRVAGACRDDENEERLVVFAEVDGPRGPIQVYCAHLSWRDDHSAVRQLQVADICALVREKRPRPFPAVLCGDLNAEPESDEIRMLTGKAAVPVPGVVFKDAWIASGQTDPGHTAAASNPWIAPNLDYDRRIDYVLVMQPKLGGVGHVVRTALAGTEAFGGVFPSDHYAVVADLRY